MGVINDSEARWKEWTPEDVENLLKFIDENGFPLPTLNGVTVIHTDKAAPDGD